MNDDVLLITGEPARDTELVEEVARRHPREVTIVIEDDPGRTEDAWAWDESAHGRARRDRLATLLSAVESRTGARVMGRIGDLGAHAGRWFDGIVDPALPL